MALKYKASYQQAGTRTLRFEEMGEAGLEDLLLRRTEKIMDYGWPYERLSPHYCHDVGRGGANPVGL